MKVSIITATYNSAETVKDAMESISSQDYPNIEHIIIDGLSSDNTMELVKAYNPAVCVSEKDHGIYDAMNKGIKHATGDLIGILNSDDFYSSHQIVSKVVEAIKSSNSDTLYANLQYVDRLNTEKVIRHWEAGPFKRNRFLTGWMPPHPTFFVRRKIYDSFGLFDTSFKSSADYELMLRLLYKEQVSTHYLEEVSVRMRVGGQSNLNFENRVKANMEDRRAWKANGIDPKFYTLMLKPLLKVSQYFKK